MRIKRIILVIYVVSILTSIAAIGKNSFAVIDQDTFFKEFMEAKKANYQERMKELVQSERPIAFELIMRLAYSGIEYTALGKDGGDYFGTAESIASVYANVYDNRAILELLRRYRAYDRKKCEKKVKGEKLITEGFSLAQTSRIEEAIGRWSEGLDIFKDLGDESGEARSLVNIGIVYYGLGRYPEALDFYNKSVEKYFRIGDVATAAALLTNIGNIYKKSGKHNEAVFYYQKFLQVSIKIKSEFKTQSLYDIGVYLDTIGRRPEALEAFSQCLIVSQKKRELKWEANSLYSIGLVMRKLHNHEESVSNYTKALEIYRRINDREGESRTLNNLGIVYEKLYNFDEALRTYQISAEISEEIDDSLVKALSYGNIGNAYKRIGRLTEALEFDLKSLKLYQVLQHSEGIIKNLNNMGLIYHQMGRFELAIDYLQQSLELSQHLRDEKMESQNLNNLGSVYFDLGQIHKALNYEQQALKIAHKIKDKLLELDTLAGLGATFDRLGRYKEAMDNYMKALDISQDIMEKDSLAGLLNNIGMLYFKIGKETEGLEYLLQSLDFSMKTKNLSAAGTALYNLAFIKFQQGKGQEGVKYLKQSIELLNKINDPVKMSQILSFLGGMLWAIEEQNLALKTTQMALKLFETIGHEQGKALCHINIALIELDSGNITNAIKEINDESIKIIGLQGDPDLIRKYYRILGKALWKSGNPKDAVQPYRKSIEVFEQIYQSARNLGNVEGPIFVMQNIAIYKEFVELLLELQKNYPEKGYDREAFKVSERVRSRVFQELMFKAGARVEFAGDETFQKMVEKEQQLIREIASLQSVFTKEMSKPEKQRNEEVVKSLKEQLSKGEKTLQEQEKEIEIKYPRYADLKRPKPLTVEELQEILKPDETVLAYSVGGNISVVFVIGKTKFELYEIPIKRNELVDLVRKLRAGFDDISDYSDLAKFDPAISYTLYQKLFAPLAPDLQGIKKLYLTADDVLYTLPFEVLVDRPIDQNAFDGAAKKNKAGAGLFLGEYSTLHYLVDTYTISYLPSASVLRSLRMYEKLGYGEWQPPLIAYADPIFSEEEEKEEAQGIKGKGIVKKGLNQDTVFTKEIVLRSTGGSGNLARLTDSADEARIIAREVKGKGKDIYLREKATEENVRTADLRKARYVLFSTHGLLGGDFSGVAEPALALTLVGNPPGTDGFLTMSEVLGLDMNAEMVILSACNTSGRGDKAGNGEGFAGLTRSFMYAGTKSILVTHWSVDSEAAKDLMVNMFRNMKRQPKPEALRDAKLKMKASVRDIEGIKVSLSHPFFWAPFVLVGERD